MIRAIGGFDVCQSSCVFVTVNAWALMGSKTFLCLGNGGGVGVGGSSAARFE